MFYRTNHNRADRMVQETLIQYRIPRCRLFIQELFERYRHLIRDKLLHINPPTNHLSYLLLTGRILF
jgi:hypothetical protein